MKQSVLAATVLYVATASAGLFGGDSTTNVQSGPGGKGGNSRGGNGGSSSSGAATGGNGGKTGRGGSVGGVSGVTAGAGYGATNNAPIIVGPSQSVVNGVPKVVPGSISFGNSVNLGGGYGGSNTVNNNGNKGGKSGSANGNNKSGNSKGGHGGKSKGGKGGSSRTGGGNSSKGGDGKLSLSPPPIPIRRSYSPHDWRSTAYLNSRQLHSLRRRQLIEQVVRRIADPELFYENEIVARDAEAIAEPEFDLEDIYARDAEPEAEAEAEYEYDGIYARDAEPEYDFEDIYARDAEAGYESYINELYARELPLGSMMVMS